MAKKNIKMEKARQVVDTTMEEGDPGLPRFKPSDRSPGTLPPGSWEPGVVEVEFREGIRPEISPAVANAPSELRSRAGADVTPLNLILRQHRLQKAEPSFQASPQEADRAQATARQIGRALPNLGNFVTLHFPHDQNVQSIAQELNQLPEVERAVPIPRAAPPLTPLDEPLLGTNDQVVLDPVTGLENQWYIFRCKANQAWGSASGEGAVIADIDWGYRTSHQDLAPSLDLTRAYNSYDGGTNVSHGSYVSHGTAVMGIAGGVDNELGIAGFAFGATLWPIQANSGPGTFIGGNTWAGAIEWVRNADSGGKRKIIILEVQTWSYGNYEMVPSVNAAIRTAIASGVVVCVAAGNGDRDAGLDDLGNPIPETGSILVGATAYDSTENRRAGFSNYGSRIVVSAPGDGSHDLTCSSSADNAYRNGFGGTSGATPKVAGTVALMLSANPNLSHDEIRTILHTTGTPVASDPTKPVGTFLNAEGAVQEALGRTTLQIEAETGERFGAFVIGTDPAASGGQYVHVPNGTGTRYEGPDESQKVHYTFQVAQAGTYRIKAWVHAANIDDNSFWVKVNGAPAGGYLWDTLRTTSYEADYVKHRGGADPLEVALAAGPNTVTIYLREDGTRLDKLELEQVGTLVQEAETGERFGAFVIGTDPAASGGQYVHVPNGTGTRYEGPDESQKVHYTFQVAQAGTYRIKAWVHAANIDDNSFWVKVNGAPCWWVPVGYSADYQL